MEDDIIDLHLYSCQPNLNTNQTTSNIDFIVKIWNRL